MDWFVVPPPPSSYPYRVFRFFSVFFSGFLVSGEPSFGACLVLWRPGKCFDLFAAKSAHRRRLSNADDDDGATLAGNELNSRQTRGHFVILVYCQAFAAIESLDIELDGCLPAKWAK